MKSYWQHLMQHAAWANRRIFDLLQTIKPVEPQPLRLFAHVLTTERIYLERMRQLEPWPQNFWPDLSLEQCAALIIENQSNVAHAVFTKEKAVKAVEAWSPVMAKYKNQ